MSMRPLIRFCAGLAFLAVIACNDTVTDTLQPNGVWSLSSIWSGQIVIAENTDAPQWPSDPVTIVSAEVKGDSLELVVNYGGGCRAQSFLLLSDAAWMESYPVQVGVRLARDAQGDNCKALLSRMLRFDLSPLKAAYNAAYQSTTGIIRLNIRGFDSVTYSW
jgi:hypothetical protein